MGHKRFFINTIGTVNDVSVMVELISDHNLDNQHEDSKSGPFSDFDDSGSF